MLELSEKSDLMAIECQCPSCRSRYVKGVPYVEVPCDKCGITYKTDFTMDIYTKKARQMIRMLSYANSLKVRSTEEYEGALTNIRHHFLEQNCWDVSEISHHKEEYRRCTQCGICTNCYTCKNDGTTFEPNPNRRKQTCPKCKGSSFVRTHFRKVLASDKNREIKLCPYCKSDKVKMTRTKNTKHCHICKGPLSNPVNSNIFEFTVSRKRAYRREMVPKG